MLQKSLQTQHKGNLGAYTAIQIFTKFQKPSLLPLPLLSILQSSPCLLRLLSPLLRLRKDPAKLVIKAKGLMGPKIKVRARGPSPPQRPKKLPRPRKLQLRQRKQRPSLKKLILRPRMLLPFSRARKKNLLLPRPGLRTQNFLVVFFCSFFL